MAQTAAEQYILELVNRARLDPQAEADRYGIDLNAGLAPGRLSAESRQVLAHDADLADAAAAHSVWMIEADTFSHTGAGGSNPGARINAEGYGPYYTYGENIVLGGSTGAIDLDSYAYDNHRALFLSAGHRVNILGDSFRELGIGQEEGRYSQAGGTYNVSMMTENFATDRSGKVYLTGVTYTDRDGDGFYSIGEGQAGLRLSAEGATTAARATGGYDLALTPGWAEVSLSRDGAAIARLSVDLTEANAKLDLIDGAGGLRLESSASLDLGAGLARAGLLGLDDLDITGARGANALRGNAGDNTLKGRGGKDSLEGAAGDDKLLGNRGADRLKGGSGDDVLHGQQGRDHLMGGTGEDRLDGGAGRDVMTGGTGADVFVFERGRDVIRDFEAGIDRLIIDGPAASGTFDLADLSGTARVRDDRVVLDFEGPQKLVLLGVSSFEAILEDITVL